MALVAAAVLVSLGLTSTSTRPAVGSTVHTSAVRSTRRELLCTAGVALGSSALLGGQLPAMAIGPTSIDLSVKKYEEIVCPPELAAGRIGGSIGAGASKGIKQRCIRVTVSGTNPSKSVVTDAAVFGRVFNSESNSVVANNPDGRTDAGQFAMIPKVEPGDSTFDFVFVATDSGNELGDLRFESLKCIAYPGGARYKPYDECEQNEAMEGCGMDED
mmetsp:Transcript_23058/g.59235  ORF Transcript_23058/g.59235 Transcript_23058/m.59235 type:complete len:216 (+) Transcript_23058:12-659(+)